MCFHLTIFFSYVWACRSRRSVVRGSNMSVGPRLWLWASPAPWCQMISPDSAPCHFTRERASPFLPQQKVRKASTCVVFKQNAEINLSLTLPEKGEHLQCILHCTVLCLISKEESDSLRPKSELMCSKFKINLFTQCVHIRRA